MPDAVPSGAEAVGSQPRDRRKFLALVPLLFVVLLPLVFMLRVHSKEVALRHRGVQTTAIVVGHYEGRSTDYLTVRFAAPNCICGVNVATSNPKAHPVGTSIAIIYDPTNPRNARALVDSPNPYVEAFPILGGLLLGALILVPLVLTASKRKRRALALLRTASPTARVRVEAWRRVLRNSNVPYLSIYPIDSGEEAAPIVVIPVSEATLKRLRSDQSFLLYGGGNPEDPVALKAGQVAVVPAGKPRPPEWEEVERAKGAEIELPGSADRFAAVSDQVRDSVFSTAKEARTWMRDANLLSFLLPLISLVFLLFLVPGHLLPVALACMVGIMLFMFAVLWRTSVHMKTLARRLSDSSQQSRTRRASLVAARLTISQSVASPDGQRGLARLLGITVEALQRQKRRQEQRSYLATGIMIVGFVIFLIRVARA